jgi:hypothetical protein
MNTRTSPLGRNIYITLLFALFGTAYATEAPPVRDDIANEESIIQDTPAQKPLSYVARIPQTILGCSKNRLMPSTLAILAASATKSAYFHRVNNLGNKSPADQEELFAEGKTIEHYATQTAAHECARLAALSTLLVSDKKNTSLGHQQFTDILLGAISSYCLNSAHSENNHIRYKKRWLMGAIGAYSAQLFWRVYGYQSLLKSVRSYQKNALLSKGIVVGRAAPKDFSDKPYLVLENPRTLMLRSLFNAFSPFLDYTALGTQAELVRNLSNILMSTAASQRIYITEEVVNRAFPESFARKVKEYATLCASDRFASYAYSGVFYKATPSKQDVFDSAQRLVLCRTPEITINQIFDLVGAPVKAERDDHGRYRLVSTNGSSLDAIVNSLNSRRDHIMHTIWQTDSGNVDQAHVATAAANNIGTIFDIATSTIMNDTKKPSHLPKESPLEAPFYHNPDDVNNPFIITYDPLPLCQERCPAKVFYRHFKALTDTRVLRQLKLATSPDKLANKSEHLNTPNLAQKAQLLGEQIKNPTAPPQVKKHSLKTLTEKEAP